MIEGLSRKAMDLYATDILAREELVNCVIKYLTRPRSSMDRAVPS